MGGLSMITLYELNQPLCWTEILIGYGSALSTTVFLTSFVGVTVFSRCGVPNLVIILIGILSVMAGMTLVAFAKTTLMMFLVRLPMLLAIMPFPVLRSMMSKIVSKNEQGALFACLACLDSVSISVAIAVFSSLYAATVTWYPGFCFLLSAGLCVIPLAMLAFAVVGSDKEFQVNGKRVLGRKTAWGVVEVENPNHCEFALLRDFLIRSHLQDLKEVTHNIHYETYRARRLNDNGGLHPISANNTQESNL